MDNAMEKEAPLAEWSKGISAITLFVEEMESAKAFYETVLGLPVIFEDDASTVFKFGHTLVNLLKTTAAPALIEPATVASREAGHRFVFTIDVDDVDAMCVQLVERGVKLLNGQIGRASCRERV